MSLERQGEIIGYHGTHSKNVVKIMEGSFIASPRNDHWLGQGVYFYTDFDLAKWWIETKNRSKLSCAIIKVILSCKGFNVLDLDTTWGLDFLLAQTPILLKKIGRYSFKVTEPYKNLCFVLDLLKSEFDIEIVICTFLKEKPSYSGQNLPQFENHYFELPFGVQYKETQVCIRTNSPIAGKECIYNNDTPKVPKNWE